jgi:hypothetical protein
MIPRFGYKKFERKVYDLMKFYFTNLSSSTASYTSERSCIPRRDGVHFLIIYNITLQRLGRVVCVGNRICRKHSAIVPPEGNDEA